MQVQIKAWGNSQGIRLSKDILEEADIDIDEVLDMKVAKGTITITKQVRHRSLEERAAEYAGRLGLDGEYDWGEPVGREVWE